MDETYLYEHTTHILRTFVGIYRTQGLPQPQLLKRFGAEAWGNDPVPPGCMAFLLSAEHETVPRMMSVSRNLYFFSLRTAEGLCVGGPVRLSAPLVLKRELEDDALLSRWSAAVALLDIPVFLHSILLLANRNADPPISDQELLSQNAALSGQHNIQQYYTDLVFKNREEGNRHNPYDQEQRLLGCITHGNLRLLESCREEPATGCFGTLAPDHDRSVRDVCISAITLASRAAIQGGVHPELAFSLCDAYIMKIEQLQDLMDTQSVVEGAQTRFAMMVNSLKKDITADTNQLTHPLVRKCKEYIFKNLHGKISLNQIADLLQTNPNYLSDLFSKTEGISFSDFVMREKIEQAKSLLIYSPLSCSEIAANLGFSSQSHFGSHFKKATGLTPMQFRNRYEASVPDIS